MKVIILDDNPVEVELIKSMLIDSDLNAEVFTGLTSILGNRLDLIILDLYMPVISGCDLCHILKTHPDFSDIPIVMLSSSTDIKDKMRCFEAGALDYIEKPIAKDSLISIVKKYSSIGIMYKAGKDINMQTKG